MATLIPRRSLAFVIQSRATLRSLNFLDTLSHRQSLSASPVPLTLPVFTNSREARGFHVRSGKLDLRASPVCSTEYALDDFRDNEEKTSGNGEGLEIAKLGISEEIVSSLARKGIVKLFPIQKAVMDPAMQGCDLFGRARTGTGKTLAFGIPIIDKILKFNAKHGRGRNPLALVLAPTRELARQVEKEFQESAPSVDTICLYGGTPIMSQMRQLDYGVDIAVGTPGRIIDLMKRGSLNLSEIQFVVLDEADQMLSVGFVDDIETIFQRLPKKRHSMLFSATMPNWIRDLIRNYLKNPLTIDLVGDSDKKLADGITLYSVASELYEKASIIGPLITQHAKGGKSIVFTQTKRDADRLSYAMARSFRCEALHGDISQAQRERTLSGFRNGNFNILVATDVAARGLDVPNVDLVVHYEIPNCSETFVHRSGRTGRAGKKGIAILIYTQDQARQVKIFEKEIGCRFSELPKVNVDSRSMSMLADMGNSGRSSHFGGTRDRQFGDKGFNRFGSQRDGGFSRFGSSRTPGSSRSDGFGFGRSAESGFSGYRGNQSDNFSGSGSGFGRTSSGFGDFGKTARSGSYGDFGSSRSTGFGDSNSRLKTPSDSFSRRFGSLEDFNTKPQGD